MLLAICAICLVALAFPVILWVAGGVVALGALGLWEVFTTSPWYTAAGFLFVVIYAWTSIEEENQKAKAKAQKEEEDKLLREYQLKLAREALGQ